MSSSTVAGLCRLRFHAPETVFELAVPADVVLADLMPAVLDYAGPDIHEKGVDHGGWILQRLGGEPLDEERTPDALELKDGDELYLRPRNEALPPVHFDDLVDGVRTGVQEVGDSWRPVMTHHLSIGLALVALAGGLALLLLPGPHLIREVIAGCVGLLLLFGAASASRAVGDAGAGTALGAAAVPYLVTAAAMAPLGTGDLTSARLLAGSSAAVGGAVLALGAVGCSSPLFLSVVLLGLMGLATGGLSLYGVTVAHSAAGLAAVAVMTGAFVPGVAFKLAGLKLPALPRNAEELQEDIEPFPARDVLTRSAVADGYLTGFFVALGLVCALCITQLALSRDKAALWTAADLSVLLLLHARAIGSLWQRLGMLLPGLWGLVLLTGGLGLQSSWNGRSILLAVLLGLATLLAVVSWTVPGRRLIPHWGRAADLLHTLTALALLPLALYACGFYQLMRGFNG